jgi:hypothetical protein
VVLAGIKVTDTALVRDAVELARTSLEPYLFNHSMRSWLFGILLSRDAELAPDPELLAVSTVLHDLGLADRYTAQDRFEVDGAKCGTRVSKGSRNPDAADASCVGCYRASHHTFHRAPQRA